MESWTSPLIRERIRQFYQEHGRNVKVRQQHQTAQPAVRVKIDNTKTPVEGGQQFRKFYFKPQKEAKVNHLTEAPTGGSDEETVYMINGDAMVEEIQKNIGRGANDTAAGCSKGNVGAKAEATPGNAVDIILVRIQIYTGHVLKDW